MPAAERSARRIDTAVQTIYNNKWLYPPATKNATYSFNHLSTTGDSIPFWYSPRQAGTLQEKQALHEELRKNDPKHLPSYVLRDRRYVEALNAKGITHEKLGLSNGELKQPVPFSLHNNFFSRRDGDFISLGHRQSVTRHHWGVVNLTDMRTPSKQSSATPAVLPPLGPPSREKFCGAECQAMTTVSRLRQDKRVSPAIPGQRGNRTEDGLKIGRGFEPSDKSKWVLQFVKCDGSGGQGGQVQRDEGGGKKEGSSTSMGVCSSPGASGGASWQLQARAHSGMGARGGAWGGDGSQFKPRASDSEKEVQKQFEARKAQKQHERRLLKTLRTRMQLRFKETSHLPINLWKAFSHYDADGSGRIEYDEFVKICHHMGINEELVGPTGIEMLFKCADKDGSGNVDFQEFLGAVVGNLVSL